MLCYRDYETGSQLTSPGEISEKSRDTPGQTRSRTSTPETNDSAEESEADSERDAGEELWLTDHESVG
jgi:hypothetical protein